MDLYIDRPENITTTKIFGSMRPGIEPTPTTTEALPLTITPLSPLFWRVMCSEVYIHVPLIHGQTCI